MEYLIIVPPFLNLSILIKFPDLLRNLISSAESGYLLRYSKKIFGTLFFFFGHTKVTHYHVKYETL